MAARRGSFLEIGGKFGIYDVVRELGRGGMGAVYLVRSPATGDELAAKVMYPESPDVRNSSVRRFIREAELAMKVEHPNLIRVHDIGRDPDTNLAYMLMDYMPGGSLRMWLKRRQEEGVGPFPIGEALAIVRAVADALEARPSAWRRWRWVAAGVLLAAGIAGALAWAVGTSGRGGEDKPPDAPPAEQDVDVSDAFAVPTGIT